MKSKGVNDVLETALESIEERDEICFHAMKRANILINDLYTDLSTATSSVNIGQIRRMIWDLTVAIGTLAEYRLENALVINKLILLITEKGE